MLHTLDLLIRLKSEIDCDRVEVSYDGGFLKISAIKGTLRLQRSYTRKEVEALEMQEFLISSTISYMKNRFHPPDSAPGEPFN